MVSVEPLVNKGLTIFHLIQDKAIQDESNNGPNKDRSPQKCNIPDVTRIQTFRCFIVRIKDDGQIWVSALPLKEYGFTLTQSKLHDGIRFRYSLEANSLLSSDLVMRICTNNCSLLCKEVNPHAAQRT